MCLDVPWGVETHDRADVEQARKILDKDHYGLDKVKERILEFIALRQLDPGAKGQDSLPGDPGRGQNLHRPVRGQGHARRKLSRLSLGGVGTRRTSGDTGEATTSAPCPAGSSTR